MERARGPFVSPLARAAAMLRSGTAASLLLVSVLVARQACSLPIPSPNSPPGAKEAEARLEMKQLGIAPFEWRMCGDGSENIQVSSASASPSPIRFSKTVQLPIDISLFATEMKEITSGSIVLLLKKRIPYTDVWETIPCISDYGSCTYDLCSCIDHVFGETCDPWFAAHGLDCHCPFKPMNLTATKATFNLPAAGNVPGWLVDGDLQAQVSVYDQDKQRALCFWIQFSVLLND